jgi:hypothetical protein
VVLICGGLATAYVTHRIATMPIFGDMVAPQTLVMFPVFYQIVHGYKALPSLPITGMGGFPS